MCWSRPRDITPLETARLDLESVLQELETAQRLARLGTWHVDFTAQTARMSGEMQRIFGLPPKAVGDVELGALVAMIHPDDLDSVSNMHLRAIDTRRSAMSEHRVIRSDGGVAHVRTFTEPVVVDDDVVGLWGTTQDISDIIASEAALSAEQARRETAEFLAELASHLNRAASDQDIVDAVHEASKQFWDLAAVVLARVEPEGSVLRLSYANTGVPDSIQARYLRTPLDIDTHMTRVVNRGEPLWLRDRATQLRTFPNLFSDVESTGAESFAAVPLKHLSSETFGALGLAWLQPRQFDAQTKGLLESIAELVARTTERLELRELERSVAQTLQLGLLALDVRSTTTIVRARYRAADASMEIGGDWYDGVPLDDGRIAIAVGDVVGRGLAAATTMGQLRAALAVTAMQADDADDAIRILDRYADRIPGAKCATAAIAIIDPASETVSYASAGHPPPLLALPDGTVRYLEGGRSWPLRVTASIPRPGSATEPMPAGSLLLLYTDGLVERKGESIDVGLARLERVVAANWNLPMRRLKQAIFRALIDDRPDAATDDVALVAARTVGVGAALFVDAFPALPSSASATRHRLRSWLEEIGIDRDTREAALVAIGEAVANAIDHGSRRDETLIVKVEAAIRDGRLIASVSDSGQWLPGAEGHFAGRGRGHLIMQSLTEDVDIDTDAQGSIVTLRIAC